MVKFRASALAAVFMVACLSSVTACTFVATDESVPFTIVAEGQPLGGRNGEPVLVAIRGDNPNPTVPEGLPDVAQAALKEIFSKPDSSLYVVVFDGQKGSTGVQVKIDSIVRRQDGPGKRLVVRYHVDSPGPGQGGGTAYTYPFVIARIADAQVEAAAVVFEGPPHPTPAVQNLPVEFVAYGAPTDSGGNEPMAFALRGGDSNFMIPDQLPKEAKEALGKVMAKVDSALYLVIYVGTYPTTGNNVGIDFVEWHRAPQNEQLVVRYRVDRYGGASVPSHPFLIGRVNSNVRPSNVVFEH